MTWLPYNITSRVNYLTSHASILAFQSPWENWQKHNCRPLLIDLLTVCELESEFVDQREPTDFGWIRAYFNASLSLMAIDLFTLGNQGYWHDQKRIIVERKKWCDGRSLHCLVTWTKVYLPRELGRPGISNLQNLGWVHQAKMAMAEKKS